MLPRKKKATFYLPEDVLRVARVHAARTDRRDSQVVEDALRAYLGYVSEESAWPTDVESTATSVGPPPAEPEPPAELEPAAQPESIPAAEPLPPLDPEEALVLAIAELHMLRDEGAGGR